MATSTEARRIEELEEALRGAIEYLSRLPAVPVTRDKMRELQQVMDGKARTPDRERTTTVFSTQGIPIVAVTALGETVWIKTPLGPEYADTIFEHLRVEVCAELRPRPKEAPLTEREQALWLGRGRTV